MLLGWPAGLPTTCEARPRTRAAGPARLRHESVTRRGRRHCGGGPERTSRGSRGGTASGRRASCRPATCCPACRPARSAAARQAAPTRPRLARCTPPPRDRRPTPARVAEGQERAGTRSEGPRAWRASADSVKTRAASSAAEPLDAVAALAPATAPCMAACAMRLTASKVPRLAIPSRAWRP